MSLSSGRGFGIVGLGSIADFHARAIQAMEAAGCCALSHAAAATAPKSSRRSSASKSLSAITIAFLAHRG